MAAAARRIFNSNIISRAGNDNYYRPLYDNSGDSIFTKISKAISSVFTTVKGPIKTLGWAALFAGFLGIGSHVSSTASSALLSKIFTYENPTYFSDILNLDNVLDSAYSTMKSMAIIQTLRYFVQDDMPSFNTNGNPITSGFKMGAINAIVSPIIMAPINGIINLTSYATKSVFDAFGQPDLGKSAASNSNWILGSCVTVYFIAKAILS